MALAAKDGHGLLVALLPDQPIHHRRVLALNDEWGWMGSILECGWRRQKANTHNAYQRYLEALLWRLAAQGGLKRVGVACHRRRAPHVLFGWDLGR